MSTLSYAAEQRAKTSLRPSRQAIKRAALALAAALGVAAAADFGHYYLTTGRYLETTDDAYVKADSTIIAPKVSGYIAQVLVNDNQPVTAGQLLAKIDDRDFRAALSQAQADVAAAEAAVRNLDAQIALQQPIIEQGTADVAAAEANLKFAREEQARYDGLMKTGSGTVQRAQQTDAALRASNAQLQHAKSGLLAAERKVDVLTTQRAQAVAQHDRARAVEQQAALNLSYTADHRAGRRHGRRALAPGRPVRAGRHAVDGGGAARCGLCRRQFQGDPAHPCAQRPAGRADHRRLPRHPLRGHVDSLSPASGLEFALLPPDNATGNFTKIVQRVPVKIVLDDHKLAGLLRPGMSAEPTVNTKSAAVRARAQSASGVAPKAAVPEPRS